MPLPIARDVGLKWIRALSLLVFVRVNSVPAEIVCCGSGVVGFRGLGALSTGGNVKTVNRGTM